MLIPPSSKVGMVRKEASALETTGGYGGGPFLLGEKGTCPGAPGSIVRPLSQLP